MNIQRKVPESRVLKRSVCSDRRVHCSHTQTQSPQNSYSGSYSLLAFASSSSLSSLFFASSFGYSLYPSFIVICSKGAGLLFGCSFLGAENDCTAKREGHFRCHNVLLPALWLPLRKTLGKVCMQCKCPCKGIEEYILLLLRPTRY